MTIRRAHITIRGIVQGVGFRPFIHRLAHQAQLTGWVNNTAQGVVIEIEGDEYLIQHVLGRIRTELPPHAHIADMQVMYIPPIGDSDFIIEKSADDGAKTAYILPDLAMCPDCLREMTDPHNRRYRYPFINCTHCGPRYSIMTDLPYDRPNTTMREFVMCADCQREYDDPADRRFHAQPIACPVCGPHIALWDADGQILATHHEAIIACADALRAGKIIALKGLGGFHLLADATNPDAIHTLRQRKHRPHKPFAVMFLHMDEIRRWCVVDDVAQDLLTSPEAPIVLLEKRIYPHALTPADEEHPHALTPADEEHPHPLTPSPLRGEGGWHDNPPHTPPFSMQWGKGAGGIGDDLLAPDNPTLGVMLPYTPLHHLLLSECGFPLIATSGNRADEPICTDEYEALTRLRGIADLFLVHNRPIQRPIDDSVVRVMAGRVMMIRRARGYAPLPIKQPHPLTPSPKIGEGEQHDNSSNTPPFYMQWGKGAGGIGDTTLAVGAHLKNAVAIRRGDDIFISQHIGDLSTAGAHHHFEQTIADLSAMLDVHPQKIVCDAHPDYASTTYAHQSGLPIRKIQHHYAHALACLAENGVELPALAVVWDGTGYGDDGTIWGGEFLRLTRNSYERVAHVRPFPLIGGDSAVIEPRKTALGWLYSLLGDAIFDDEQYAPVRQFTPDQRRVLRQMVQKKVNCPMTSSMGRLFDAVASLMDVCHVMTHEAQAAVMLEYLASQPHPLAPINGERPHPLAPMNGERPHPLAPSPLRGEGEQRNFYPMWDDEALKGLKSDIQMSICSGDKVSSQSQYDNPIGEHPSPLSGLPNSIARGFEPLAGHPTAQTSPLSMQSDEAQTSPLSMQWGGDLGVGLLTSLMADINAGIPKTVISHKFHVTLIEIIIHTAQRIGERRVLLTGGCFLNKPLLEGAIIRLREAGFIPYWHSQVPTGDGGICFGQAVAWMLSS